MPAIPFVRVPEDHTYSHIYNVGVEQQPIFKDEKDYEVFISYLKEYLTAPQDPNNIKTTFTVKGRTYKGTPHLPKNYYKQLELVAYSLMPNHFHLIIHQTTPNAIQGFIRSLSTRYSIYFNKKYSRNGALFNGPYRSIQLKAMPELLYKSRYLHKESVYSSFKRYINEDNAQWINPSKVLTFFSESTNSSVNELSNYKSFVELARVEQQQKSILSNLTFEEEDAYLERKILTSDLESKQEEPTINSQKQKTRIPEYVGLTTLFVALLSLGIRNINANSSVVSINNTPAVLAETISEGNFASISPTPTVTSTTDMINNNPVVSIEVTPSPTPIAIKENTLRDDKETPVPSPSFLPGTKIVVVKITDGSKSVYVRQEPNIYADKIAEVKDKEIFEYISTSYGWYEIKLENGTNGFISPKYSNIQQTR